MLRIIEVMCLTANVAASIQHDIEANNCERSRVCLKGRLLRGALDLKMRPCLLTTAVLTVIGLAPLLQPGQSYAQPLLDTEVTADGLHRVAPSVMASAWLRPDRDLSEYTRIFVMPTIVLFREMPEPAHSSWALRSVTEFPVSEKMQARLSDVFGESFHQAMTENTQAYEVSDELGRDVLLVRGYLTDVITGLPPQLAGSNVGTIRWVWKANAIVEVRDAMSDELLARTIDRLIIEGPVDADRVWGLAPRIMLDWSRLMAGRLTELAGFYSSRLWRLQQQSEGRPD